MTTPNDQPLTRPSQAALAYYREQASQERTQAEVARQRAAAVVATNDPWTISGAAGSLDVAAKAEARAAQWDVLASELEDFADATRPPAQEGLL